MINSFSSSGPTGSDLNPPDPVAPVGAVSLLQHSVRGVGSLGDILLLNMSLWKSSRGV